MSFNSAEAVPILISAVSAAMLATAALTTPVMHPGPVDATQYAAATNEADVSSGIRLDRVGNPAQTLPAATVQTSKGKEIGRVQSVELDAGGKPVTVKIATGGLFGVGTLTKSVSAQDLLYIKSRNALVSRLTATELGALPTRRRKH